jgi:hypothetical protein
MTTAEAAKARNACTLLYCIFKKSHDFASVGRRRIEILAADWRFDNFKPVGFD